MSLNSNIRDNTSYHARLLADIADLDYVPSALVAQERYCNDLERELEESMQRCDKLAAGANELRKKKAFGSDRRYAEAMLEANKARQDHARIQGLLEDARRSTSALSLKSEELMSLQQELDRLYERVFDTTDLPRDQDLRMQLSQAQEARDMILNQVSSELRAVEFLDRAVSLLKESVGAVKKLIKYSTQFRSGPSQLERNTILRDMFHKVGEAEKATRDARQLRPAVARITGFPNKTSFNLYNIQTAPALFEPLERKVKAEHTATVRRAKSAALILAEANLQLKRCRDELYAARRDMFQAVVDSGADASMSLNYVGASAEPRSSTMHVPSALQVIARPSTPPPPYAEVVS